MKHRDHKTLRSMLSIICNAVNGNVRVTISYLYNMYNGNYYV